MWKVPVTQKPDQCLGEWIDREALAEAMIPLIGQLYRNNNVVSSIYGRSLINQFGHRDSQGAPLCSPSFDRRQRAAPSTKHSRCSRP